MNSLVSLNFLKKIYLLPVFFLALIFVSCQDKKQEEAASETVAPPSELTVDQKRQQLRSAAPAPAPAATSSGTAQGNINPPHGQPGHRCDIPVGAPLDSKPGQGVKAVQTTPAASGSGESPRINPPHGQPGHRCDVRVGDPLP